MLPLPGMVLVTAGQKVNATDVIAETRLANQHLLLDVAQTLGIAPHHTHDYLNVAINQVVAKGDVIAGPVGFPPRSLRSPQDGKVVHINDGKILLELESQPYQLQAGLEGVIQKVVPERGAILETYGALVQGMWGNGRIAQGNLKRFAPSTGSELTCDDLEGDLSGSILLSGHISRAETIKCCKEYSIRGLILASLPASLVPLAAQCNFPIIILEGFGKIPMNSAAFKILSANEGKEIAVNASGWERYSDTRPEVIIPLPATFETNFPLTDAILTPGQSVRINSSTMKGIIGKLIALNKEQAVLANGLKVPVATIHLENGESICVPLANLEVLAQ
ncbi:MAG: hypothetical protein C0391_01710 [Anaerolinea sp.]|nr:hypothetical protein [Anaerolinea sp.]